MGAECRFAARASAEVTDFFVKQDVFLAVVLYFSGHNGAFLVGVYNVALAEQF